MSAAESAKFVIIGGGTVGCGVAYQLALATRNHAMAGTAFEGQGEMK